MAKKKINKLSEVLTENFWSVWLLIVISLILIFVSKQDALANFVWREYRWPETAIWLDKSDADLAMQIGNYYFNGVIGSHEYDVGIAEKAFEKAVSINPKVLWGHYQLARIYFVEGDFYKAIEEINLELKYNPENIRSFYVRGLIFGYRDNLANAEADFRRFTEWSPLEWAGYNDLAWILEKEGKYGEAEKTVKAALSNVPDTDENPWIWNALGVAQLNLKKYKNAAVSFEKAKELAEKLTEEEWHHSYPGNDPATAVEGLPAFKAAIDKNLERAEKAGVDK